MNGSTSEREIFLIAVDMTDSLARSQYLDEACAGNELLRKNVDELLQAASVAGDFLEQPPVGMALTVRADTSEAWGVSIRDLSLDFLTPSDKPGCLGQLRQYEVVGFVGRGGFGLVLRAFDTKLNRIVAIKVMAPELASNRMAVKRFLREAQAAAAVSHDHIVTIHAIEEANSPPFLVMEYIDGQSLKHKVDQDGAMELAEILRVGMQMASGLAAAHRQGLVHRDIKPANILLENGIERVKITDFGLARAVDDVDVTQTGMIAGTPQYMSPEQGLGKPIDARSDLFSLGSVLYTLSTGRSAFRADSAVATLRRVCDDAPRSLREINPQIPDWLEQIVMRLLEKDAQDRYQSAADVAELLGGCLAHVQTGGGIPLPEKLPGTTKPQDSGRAPANSLYAVLAGTQIVAIVGSVIAAIVNLESIVFTGPLFGVALGTAIAIVGAIARLGWVGIGFGLSSVLLSALVFLTIVAFNLSPNDVAPIMAEIIPYALTGIPWGIVAIQRARKGEQVPWTTLLKSQGLFVTVFVIQLLGIASSAVMAAVEIHSIVVTGLVFGLLGAALLTTLTFIADRSRLSRIFAMSAPVVSLVLLLVLLTSNPNSLNSARQIIAVPIVLYSMVIIPLGFVALSKEIGIVGADFNRPQFEIKTALIGTALFAVAFTIARPCFAFGVNAFLAGGLFSLTVIGTAFLLAYWFYKQEGSATPVRWAALGGTALLILATHAILVVWYDGATDFGYIVVRTPEKVRLRVEHVRSGTVDIREIDEDGQLLGRTRSGTIDVRVLDRDDLQVVPTTMKVLRNIPMELRVRKSVIRADSR